MPQENNYTSTTKDDLRRMDGVTQGAGGYGGSSGTPPSRAETKDAMQNVQDTAAQVGDKITERTDAGIEKAAEGLGQASDQLRQKAQEQGGVPGQLATKMADGLDKTSEYLEGKDTAQIMEDVEAYVKDHPMQALAGAVVGGFVLARVLR